MNIFISFASPHLGVSENRNTLVSAGVWFLASVSKVRTMKQLRMDMESADGLSQ